MADIDFGQLSEALNDKSDRDLRNVDTTAKADAVIDFQLPTADNNYTWYRLYASGWVEQGGVTSGGTYNSPATITMPITMNDTNYCLVLGVAGQSQYSTTCAWRDKTTTTFRIENGYNGSNAAARITNWQVSGMAAN